MQRKVLILVAVLAIVGALVTRPMWWPGAGATGNTNLPVIVQLEQAQSSGKPTVYVFVWEDSCCPPDEEFASNFWQSIGPYENDISYVWMNPADPGSVEDQQAIGNMATRLEVQYAPAVVLTNSTGQVVQVQEGEVDFTKLSSGLKEIL